uniref:Mitochondrial ATP synthase regulatory component factor B n=1 Tax=Panagrellus redivivus TaxID=6233 RepID=A0A7E4VB26_PANRE
MSFCLSTLPYGLKRCLQELAKPYEVLQLQDASGTCMPGFCPRPFRRRFHREAKLTIERKNDALKMVAVGGYTKSEHYVVCERELTLHKLTADHFSSEEINWSKLVLRPKIVTISYCDLSPQFMAKLASMDLGTKKELTIHNCTGLVDFEALFKAFPNVEELKVIGVIGAGRELQGWRQAVRLQGF